MIRSATPSAVGAVALAPLLLLACTHAEAKASAFGFYDEKRHGIVELTSKNWKTTVKASAAGVWMVEFFAPWSVLRKFSQFL